jgi:hypothetical protein
MQRRTPVLISLGIFVLAGAIMFIAWLVLDLDATHFTALGAGVFLTVAVGVGLMTLVFYSSRSGHDERAHQAQADVNIPPARRKVSPQDRRS